VGTRKEKVIEAVGVVAVQAITPNWESSVEKSEGKGTDLGAEGEFQRFLVQGGPVGAKLLCDQLLPLC